MSNKIKHSGVVERVVDDSVQVHIVQTSACSACKVAAHCNAAESKEKIIEVRCDNAADYHVGQQVVVSTSGQVAARALLWGFGIPFVVLVAVLLLALCLTGSEGIAALSGLAALAPYYGILYLFRDRMREHLAFAIE